MAIRSAIATSKFASWTSFSPIIELVQDNNKSTNLVQYLSIFINAKGLEERDLRIESLVGRGVMIDRMRRLLERSAERQNDNYLVG